MELSEVEVVEQVVRCRACGASIDTGKPVITAGELGELAHQLAHLPTCARKNTPQPADPPPDTNAYIRPYDGGEGEAEIVGKCHPEEGVTVLANTCGTLGSDILLECRGCGRSVAAFGYRMDKGVPSLVVDGRPPPRKSLRATLCGPVKPTVAVNAAAQPTRWQRAKKRRKRGAH
jgi:hypothetical protein